MRPDVVIQRGERELNVEGEASLRSHFALALVALVDDVAVLDAEEERGAEGDGLAAGGGELAHDVHDCGVLVGLDGVVQGNVAAVVFGEEG